MKRLLLFAYFYPPLGGPPVYRPVKLVKYLSKLGWETDVISVKNITYHSIDSSLAAEDKAANVFRTASFDPMSLLNKVASGSRDMEKTVYFKTPEFFKKILRSMFFIDDKIGWYPKAYNKASMLCKIKKYDAVMGTMGPYTSGVIACVISEKYNIPLIADFRDYWTQNPFLKFPTFIHKKVAEAWEHRMLKQSTLYTTTSSIMGADLAEKYDTELLNKNHVMYNGWDDDDFTGLSVKKNESKKIISYIGTLYSLRTPSFFINVLKKMKKSGELPQNVTFRFVGNFYAQELNQLQDKELSEYIEIIPQVEHNEAVKLMVNSDALLIFNPTIMGNGIVPGKLFESLRTARPILAMVAPKGEVATILQSQGHDLVCAMEDEIAVEENLKKLLKRIDSNTNSKFASPDAYSRVNQTKCFLNKLEINLRLS